MESIRIRQIKCYQIFWFGFYRVENIVVNGKKKSVTNIFYFSHNVFYVFFF